MNGWGSLHRRYGVETSESSTAPHDTNRGDFDLSFFFFFFAAHIIMPPLYYYRRRYARHILSQGETYCGISRRSVNAYRVACLIKRASKQRRESTPSTRWRSVFGRAASGRVHTSDCFFFFFTHSLLQHLFLSDGSVKIMKRASPNHLTPATKSEFHP